MLELIENIRVKISAIENEWPKGHVFFLSERKK